MKHKYTVILEAEAEGGYHVYCPALSGCRSEGATVDEALANIKEAVELYLESLIAHGEAIPVEPKLVIASTEIETHAQVALSHA